MLKKRSSKYFAALVWAMVLVFTAGNPGFSDQLQRPEGAPPDVLPEYHNEAVTALSEECETVRLALGGAWDDSLACRAIAGYIAPWSDQTSREEAEALCRRGVEMFELMKGIDEAIQGLRMGRDSRDEPTLTSDLAFWRNELGLAAEQVVEYAEAASDLRSELAQRAINLAADRGIRRQFIEEIPWENPDRETWRQQGVRTGVRLPLNPHPESIAYWWNQNVSFEPGYIAQKLRRAGHSYVFGETPPGAWGQIEQAPGEYDWRPLNEKVRMLQERGLGFLLELPTVAPRKTLGQIEAEVQGFLGASRYVWTRYAASLPDHMARDPEASLIRIDDDGERLAQGGVQLFNPDIAAAYREFLKAMAANLREEELYESIAAVHLERSDPRGMPEDVDYSDLSQQRWHDFLSRRWGTIADYNEAVGRDYDSFDAVPLPVKEVVPAAAEGWAEFLELDQPRRPNNWGRFLTDKYGDNEGIRAALGDDFRDGYGWRLPFDYPEVVRIDYLHFRREWMRDYLNIKRSLVARAFPDKHIITETWQMGDHDGIAGVPEAIWGGLYAEDHGQHTGTGPANEDQSFMFRSLGPVGFGTRVSDAIESLYRDYLWFNYCNPGNLARYFYDWVAHGYMDYQFGWQAITNHWLTNQLVCSIGTTVANTAPDTRKLGLLMPRATHDLADGPVYYSYMGWDWLLHAAKLPYTRIEERFIAEGGLEEIDLEYLILPRAPAMSNVVADAIRQWVENGGTLVAATMPGTSDVYGRPYKQPLLHDLFGARTIDTTSEAIADTPLTVTIPRGIFSGGRAESTDRTGDFEVLEPAGAEVMARYESGKPAITRRGYGQGRAILMGYPFGYEGVIADRTSIGFQRTYTWFVREPQVVDRAAWLRRWLVEELGYDAEYGVDYAEIGRYGGKEERAMGLSVPKGFSDDPEDFLFMRSFGDPRPEHELGVVGEENDIGVRFFPRRRRGLDTTFLGISTREVHYISPRANVNIFLSRREYRCRINNPHIQAIWDLYRDVPVGFERDEQGVSFTVSVPSGHLMMLALSETPAIEMFEQGRFAGTTATAALERTRQLAGGEQPQAVSLLNAEEYREWFENLPDEQPVLISYGDALNHPAAERLAQFLRDEFDKDASIIEQSSRPGDYPDIKVSALYEPRILIGNDWTNNDMALHGAYWNWNAKFGPHLPFTATWAWPGEGRAVVGLSRRYALINTGGQLMSWIYRHDWRIRPVEDRFPQVRRRLFIAGDGDDALKAVDGIIEAAR